MRKCFRPRIGDYFFLLETIDDTTNEYRLFPSPYRGLFFYYRKTFKEAWAVVVAVSVPVLEIIFLSSHIGYIIQQLGFPMFPSPYWGLFFYRML